jgi:hypothetical protein
MLGCDVMVFDDSKITNEITMVVTSIPIENNFMLLIITKRPKIIEWENYKFTSK